MSDAATPRSTPALLTDRTFGPWFAGNLLSNSGNWLHNVAAAVVVFNLTGSALLVGLATAAQFASLAVLAPWAGALSDRIDRRRLLLGGQAVAATSAAALATIAVTLGLEGHAGAWTVIAATGGIGVGIAFASPALNALVPALVPDEDLESGVALTSLTFNVGRALGPAAGGIILATVGASTAFAVNAFSFLALIGVLLVIRPRPLGQPEADGDRSVRAGLRYVRSEATLFALLLGVGTIGFASDPVNTLTPALAGSLGGGDGLVAFLVSAFGVGAAATALATGRLQRALGLATVARAGALLLAVGLVAAAVAPTIPVALGAYVLMGIGFLLGLTSFTALLQRRVREDLRGRVMALWAVAFLGTRPVAALVDGAAADAFGVRPAFVIPVAVALAGTIVATRVGEPTGFRAARSRRAARRAPR
ncbi:MFS transporter [Egibacter rhizosphaerae]|uniref:MFS transporter n=1 Tax=Egibacter rhizosphaerae TaxID=1670831 RepID=UPI0013F171BE|nr:MFS transporter [Egibacter rhizosphaerae]